jgi:hypothetical protein
VISDMCPCKQLIIKMRKSPNSRIRCTLVARLDTVHGKVSLEGRNQDFDHPKRVVRQRKICHQAYRVSVSSLGEPDHAII